MRPVSFLIYVNDTSRNIMTCTKLYADDKKVYEILRYTKDVCQKSAACRIFKSFLNVSFSDEMLLLMLDTLFFALIKNSNSFINIRHYDCLSAGRRRQKFSCDKYPSFYRQVTRDSKYIKGLRDSDRYRPCL